MSSSRAGSGMYGRRFRSSQLMLSNPEHNHSKGYLPVALLTWYAYTNQQLSNHLVESGPDFITRAPSAEETACQTAHFPVCDGTESVAAPAAQQQGTAAQNQGAIIAVTVVVVVLARAVG
eukprot:998426_1